MNRPETKIVPYGDSRSKKEQITHMFNVISKRYDFLNHFLSAGVDKSWRRKAIASLRPYQPRVVLDVAAGTADMTIEAAASLRVKCVIGIDLSEAMMEIGRRKIEKRGLADKIELITGDSENLPFEDNHFDAVTSAFGVRNFDHLEKGLEEMFRVLKPDGRLLILEFSRPKTFLLKQLYYFYFTFVLSRIGKIVSKDKGAYAYLPHSVKSFPDGANFLNVLQKIGFKDTKCTPLTFGICSIYAASK